ncbi:cyclin-like protein [Zychaea mexicana]|uniref:cyclin-like protein n=1 Tax=Zychaea mexicana TaxID=64656 RepID=UPI0022FEED57|nr:cyclin-like protein [Zychaea mexicana]KAI9493883.1 cyclin-like protein [Zychaea mexicana]
MSVAEERKHRIYGCTFIQAIGCRLELAQLTISTAMVYFHRFFARESFTVYKYEYIAATCVYLACKVEESSRKASDVATACIQYRPNRGSSDEEKAKIIRAILWHEHILLDILCFDFTVEHPYRFLIDFAEELGTSETTLQAAWAFANDSLRLTLCLLYPPHVIAAGCLLLAYRLNSEQLPRDGDLVVSQVVQVLRQTQILLRVYERTDTDHIIVITAINNTTIVIAIIITNDL